MNCHRGRTEVPAAVLFDGEGQQWRIPDNSLHAAKQHPAIHPAVVTTKVAPDFGYEPGQIAWVGDRAWWKTPQVLFQFLDHGAVSLPFLARSSRCRLTSINTNQRNHLVHKQTEELVPTLALWGLVGFLHGESD